jgi:hypothetical protein
MRGMDSSRPIKFLLRVGYLRSCNVHGLAELLALITNAYHSPVIGWGCGSGFLGVGVVRSFLTIKCFKIMFKY